MIGPGLVGSSFSAYSYGFDSGLVGQLLVWIEDSDGNQVTSPSGDGIVEFDAGGGSSAYRWQSSYPPAGEYVVTWEDPDGVQAVEELISTAVAPVEAAMPQIGPCQPWISSEHVAACCDVEPDSDNQADLDAAASMASDLLYRLSARKFPGICLRVVRPCRTGCACDHSGEDWYWRGTEWVRGFDARACGCGCVSQVTLSGTVRTVVQVLIDGELVAPDSYRIDDYRHLVRLADADGNRQAWPRCQRLDLPSSATGTFEVTYLSGLDPPALGIAAAASLACEFFRACPSGSGECALPSGVTRIIRAGLTIERVSSVASMLSKGASGLPLVDAFIAGYNSTGASLGPMVWSPDMPVPRRMS